MKRNQHAPRILGGRYRGRALHVPPGLATRPLRALARRSLFDILRVGIPGCRFLDLFAGAGTVGLEAASLGAGRVVLVERQRAALAALERSVHAFDASGLVRIVPMDVSAFVRQEVTEPFDIIFLGPPYALYEGSERELLDGVLDRVRAWLAPRGTLVLEHPARLQQPTVSALTLVESRTYSETCLSFFRVPGGQIPQG
ncbi:MAG: RsmD family RNA methyltransferase [Planctomycetota bacterium]